MNPEDNNWYQMTVMERCEVLKAGLDRLSASAPRDSEYTRTHADYREILLLCERVAALEDREVDALTVEPGWSVSKAELARLRRVEKAAREFVADACPKGVSWHLVEGLCAALDSKPER